MRRTSPDRAQPGLHAEPLNIAIGQLFAPYCPGTSAMVIDSGNTENTIRKKTFRLQLGYFFTSKSCDFLTQNGPPTQLIDAQCALQIWDNIIVAEEHS